MEAKDEVKQRLSVEDVVGEYLELKRSGRNLKALSPFTGEKTASFMVSPEKQIWHDFSSNQGGDIFSFVMLMEGLDFREALEMLARKAGVELTQFQGDKGGAERKEKLYKAVELAVKYYHASLVKNAAALDYVTKKRGYGKNIVQSFMIGYSPNTGNALNRFLTKKGFDQKDIKDAGLSGRSSGNDMFRGRIMVPLMDGQGRAIGFTARVLDDSLPKYINTPQTILYDKSRHVFGLNLAKESIRQQGFAVIVEGNMDVIASHKADVKNVVATAGTAITKSHLQQLSRLAQDIRLAFDSDEAGISATERSIPIAQEVGVQLSIIDIEGGKDPDDLIKKDPELWQKAVNSSVYVMDWLIKRYQELNDVKTAAGKRQFTDTVLTTLSLVADPVEQEHYLNLVADITGVSQSAVRRKLEQLTKQPAKRKKSPKTELKPDQVAAKSAYQDLLLGLNLLHPDVQASLKNIRPSFFDGSDRQKVMRYIIEHRDERVAGVPTDLHEVADYVKIIQLKTEELYDDWSSSDRMIEAIGLARRLTRDNQGKRKAKITAELKTAEETGDDSRREVLLNEFNQLLKEK